MRSDPGTPVRFGVLGCADIARRRMAPALVAAPGARLLAVASRDAARAAAFAGRFGCAAVLGYDALLASPDIEAVYLPLPAMLHAGWIEQALMAGKHVLAEKPLTGDHAATERLLRLARSRGLVLMENVAFPFHAQHAAVRRMLTGGAVGELRDFACAFTIPPRPDGDIRYRPDVGGGALLDLGVYPIRAALHYLGHDLEVTAAVLRRHGRTGAVVSGRVLAHTPRGVTADLHFGMEHSYRATCEFAGGEGRLSIDRAFTPPPGFQPVARVERQDHREEIALPADDQYANTVGCFAEAVRGAAGTGAGTDTGTGLGAHTEAALHQARLIAAAEERALRFIAAR
ncbi:Gfo/Idh/MocA family protein [Actinomadura fibrosa]|uniref:Gfo/Idh/MocA family protein n=1 Tax=Actinomadura fibrosa TaxID=111802 RepID=A0ABW2XU17_9ACTN|nr:Gfo/Idh/MocA family oxidoreductase [Actinomadura fibrosa]